jgi:multisubunit Na+/H+ antiporter MnhC subunit
MNLVLKIMFVVFLVWMTIGVYLLNIEHQKAQITMGLGIFYFSFLLMPIFIYHRYKDGKYKKYILNDQKLREAFNKKDKI